MSAFDAVAADIETCQRPDGGNAISRKVGSGLYSHLLALGEERGHDNCTRSTQLFAAKVSLGHVRFHGNSLRVAEGELVESADKAKTMAE